MRKRIETSFAVPFAKGKTAFCCRTGEKLNCNFLSISFTAIYCKQGMRLPLVVNTVVESNALFCVMIYTDL